jgi:alkylated DNA repair protein alkB family protein 8
MDQNYAKFLIEKTKKDYNLIAKDFSGKRKEIWEELLFLFEDLTEKEKILDLGCGNGRWYKIFKEKKVEYIGVDNSEKLIEIAKKNFSEGNFILAEAISLPFENNFFDKVYCIALLHQIPSDFFRKKVLLEIKRVLKPEGKLILTVWKIFRLKEKLLLLKYTILKLLGRSKLDWRDVFIPWGKKTLRYYHCFSEKELKKLLKETGFEILKFGLVKNKKKNRQNFYAITIKKI